MLIAGLTWSALGVLWAGAFLGALAAGGAGFAFALTASAIWLHVLDPVHTTMLVVTSGAILHAILVLPMLRQIEPGRFGPFALGGLVGIPIGVAILSSVDVGGIRAGLGGFLVLYGCYSLLAPRLPLVRRGGAPADGLIGLLGGVLGGLGGFSGVLPTIWTQLRGWPKETARGVFQPYILMAHVGTMIVLGAVALDGRGAILVLLVLPPLLLGTAIGWAIYGRLNEVAFRRLLSAMLLVSGLSLVL